MWTTPRSWALFENPVVAQLIKNFSAFYGIRKFITVLTTARIWTFWNQNCHDREVIEHRGLFFRKIAYSKCEVFLEMF
jgi:hypothetical protein